MMGKLRDMSGYVLVVNTANILFVGQAMEVNGQTKQGMVMIGKSIIYFVGGTTQVVEGSPEQVLEQLQGIELYKQ